MKNETITLQVNLNKGNIAEGRVASCQYCPVALAIKDAVLQNWPMENLRTIGVKVTIRRTILWIGNVRYLAHNPKMVKEFIKKFDLGFEARNELAPISFDLNFIWV